MFVSILFKLNYNLVTIYLAHFHCHFVQNRYCFAIYQFVEKSSLQNKIFLIVFVDHMLYLLLIFKDLQQYIYIYIYVFFFFFFFGYKAIGVVYYFLIPFDLDGVWLDQVEFHLLFLLV